SVNQFVMPSLTEGTKNNPTPPQGSKTLHLYQKAVEPSALARLRSKKTKENGKKLAAAAIRLKGMLYWLPRSTEGFMGTSTNEHPASGQGVNLFVQWLCGPAFDLVEKPKPRVNCWESVFYTAYCAGLISKGVIRGIYEEAVSIARNRFGEKNMLGLM